jgi:hypothetical protein
MPTNNTERRSNLTRVVTFIPHYSQEKGTWGIAPAQAVCEGHAFDPAWSSELIFHDVFEHSHEGIAPFTGKYAMNIAGEMAASGAMYYFIEDLKLTRFPYSKSSATGLEAMTQNTLDLISEALSRDNSDWAPKTLSPRNSDKLLCNVPEQALIPSSSNLENDLIRYWQKYVDVSEKSYRNSTALGLRDSISFKKIANLHRWGWWEAKRQIPPSQGNIDALARFIDAWEWACQAIDPRVIAQKCDSIDIIIDTQDSSLEWRIILTLKNGSNIAGNPFEMPFKALNISKKDLFRY